MKWSYTLPWLVAAVLFSIYIHLEHNARKSLEKVSFDFFDEPHVPNVYCYNAPRWIWFERMMDVEWITYLPSHRASAILYLDVYHKAAYRDFMLKYDDMLWEVGVYKPQNPTLISETYKWYNPKSEESFENYHKKKDFCRCWSRLYAYEMVKHPDGNFIKAYDAVCTQKDSFVSVSWLEDFLEINK